MNPIRASLLVNTVTLFNVFKDPDTGAVTYYRSFLEAVRVSQPKLSLAESLRGTGKTTQISVLMDRRGTQAFIRNEAGAQVIKTYFDWRDWVKLPDAEKALTWTLNVGSLMAAVIGQIETICPEFDTTDEQNFKIEHDLRNIVNIKPNIDKDGSIHSWVVGLD